MKKLVLGAAAAAAVAAPVALIPSVAGATGSTGNQLSINQYADFNFAGSQLDLGLQVSCTGGTGLVNVMVDQAYPETPVPTGAHGTGVANVVCDGKTRYVTVTIVGVLYDGGKAKATATLVPPSGDTKSTSREISIRAT